MPMVVVVDSETGSAAEHAARLLQLEAGAVVVGEPTGGGEARVSTFEGDDGSTLRLGVVRLLDRRGGGIQRDGVIPDISAATTLEDLADGPAGVRAADERRLALALATARRLADERSAGEQQTASGEQHEKER
jgi:C-terminal processing protease CtpA/Prc